MNTYPREALTRLDYNAMSDEAHRNRLTWGKRLIGRLPRPDDGPGGMPGTTGSGRHDTLMDYSPPAVPAHKLCMDCLTNRATVGDRCEVDQFKHERRLTAQPITG